MKFPTPVFHSLYAVAFLSLFLGISFVSAELVDNFSKNDWEVFPTTPGKITRKTGEFILQKGEGEPNWVTAKKVFRVNLDKNPILMIHVDDVSPDGSVKAIRMDNRDKKDVIRIDRPGLYAADLTEKFGWKGTLDIEVDLYALGSKSSVTLRQLKFTEKISEEEKAEIAKRDTWLDSKQEEQAPFYTVPHFNTCSVYFTSPLVDSLQMRYRVRGGPWLAAYPPSFFPDEQMYRGSIVNLMEDTEYQLELIDKDGKTLAEGDFTTWKSDVPVAKTIVLDENSFDGRLVIRESGSPEGWIRYTAKEGFVLENDRQGPMIELQGAKYILIDGLTMRGGLQSVIVVDRCEQVRIANCDISGWGRVGIPRYDLDGKFYLGERAINWDAAIRIIRSLGTVVERCYIHGPVSTANSWYYSHPAGPQAVGIDKPQSTVLRYNDFVGSDKHRWNDAVEGAGNYAADGGFNRDADIYGSFHCFANDDAIEIDGGQTNVRVFRNKFEGSLCGVSIQGCMTSPSYVFQNLLVNMGDERGVAAAVIKTSYNDNGTNPISHIFHNTTYGKGRDLSLPPDVQIVALNNIFMGRSAITGIERSPKSIADYNLLSAEDTQPEKHGFVAEPGFVDVSAGLFGLDPKSRARGRGIALANFSSDAGQGGEKVDVGAVPFSSGIVLPERPIPVYLDRYQLNYTTDEVKHGASQSIQTAVSDPAFTSSWRIAQDDAFDWFTVSPDQGMMKAGDTPKITVTLIPERMKERRYYRGAFLVRMENGFSRPVTVYAETDYVQAIKPESGEDFVAYVEAETPSGGEKYKTVSDARASDGKCVELPKTKTGEPTEYRFSVPKDDHYVILMRIRSEDNAASRETLFFSMDGGERLSSSLSISPEWGWSMAAQNGRSSFTCLQAFRLSEGEHVLRIAPRSPILLDLIAVTPNPGLFDY